MPEYQKRHIAVSPEERRRLEAAKQRFEQTEGSSDWGGFLTAVTAAGLAALGVYGVAKLRERSERSVNVVCPDCAFEFTVALAIGAQGPATIIEFDCPHCPAELVLDLASDRRRHSP